MTDSAERHNNKKSIRFQLICFSGKSIRIHEEIDFSTTNPTIEVSLGTDLEILFELTLDLRFSSRN